MLKENSDVFVFGWSLIGPKPILGRWCIPNAAPRPRIPNAAPRPGPQTFEGPGAGAGGGAEWETPGPEFSNGLVRTPFEPKPELGPSSPGRNHGIRHAFSGPELLAKMMPILQKWRQADP